MVTEGTPSWVIVSKETGKGVYEFWGKSLINKVNTEKYFVLTIYDYLVYVNKNIQLFYT